MPKPLAPSGSKLNPRLGLRVIVWLGVAAGLAWGAKEANSFLLSDPRFEIECEAGRTTCAALEIQGAIYTSQQRIQAVFAPDFGLSVFHVPLAERRRHLLAVDWVNTASVSRLWPNRIVVAITERRPVAFAKLPIGDGPRYRLALIDGDGVLLSLPPRVRFRLPVLSGVTENQTEAERRERVNAMQRLLDDLGPQAKDISEINAAIAGDMRIIAAVGPNVVELLVGDRHYRSRYLNFLNHYDEIRKRSGDAGVFDLRLDDRILAK
jgi:cell division protein FtsQ